MKREVKKEDMNRLTTDKPNGNFATTLNFVYSKDGWAYIRSDGVKEDVALTSWAYAQCVLNGCDEFRGESPEAIDQRVCSCVMDAPGCPVALAYCFASQASHMRNRLKRYEDILFSEDGMELVSLDELQTAVEEMEVNPPLTLEELREMDGDPVWVNALDVRIKSGYGLVCANPFCGTENFCVSMRNNSAYFATYGKFWLAYRRKLEEERYESTD